MPYSGQFGLKMPQTSPFLKPRSERLWATMLIESATSLYVNVRPVGPSISAGLSASSCARCSTNGVSAVSGMDISGYGPLIIISVLTGFGILQDLQDNSIIKRLKRENPNGRN